MHVDDVNDSKCLTSILFAWLVVSFKVFALSCYCVNLFS